MALAEADAASYLAGQSLSLTVGTNLFKFGFVDGGSAPDAQTTIQPVPGLESEGNFGKDGVRFEVGRFQLASRANDPIDAFNTAHGCWLAFWKVEAESLGGTFYHFMRPAQRPFSIGADANGREQYAFNVDWKRDLGQ